MITIGQDLPALCSLRAAEKIIFRYLERVVNMALLTMLPTRAIFPTRYLFEMAVFSSLRTCSGYSAAPIYKV